MFKIKRNVKLFQDWVGMVVAVGLYVHFKTNSHCREKQGL